MSCMLASRWGKSAHNHLLPVDGLLGDWYNPASEESVCLSSVIIYRVSALAWHALPNRLFLRYFSTSFLE